MTRFKGWLARSWLIWASLLVILLVANQLVGQAAGRLAGR